VDLLNPPPPGEDRYLDKWRQDIRAVQDQLYLLEPNVGSAVKQSTQQALEGIATGLDAFNQLLEFSPDYKGDDETNEKRKAIIQAAADPIGKGIQTVKDAEEGGSVLSQVPRLTEWTI
jgi:hypothetical protein